MNERIRELANLAGVDAGQTIANIICGDDEFKALGNEFNKLNQATRECIYKLIEQNQEKFAELIVRECATAFEAEVDTWKEMDPYQGSIKRQGTKAIKKHFGVEE